MQERNSNCNEVIYEKWKSLTNTTSLHGNGTILGRDERSKWNEHSSDSSGLPHPPTHTPRYILYILIGELFRDVYSGWTFSLSVTFWRPLPLSLFLLLFRVLADWLLLHWLDSLSDSGDDVWQAIRSTCHDFVAWRGRSRVSLLFVEFSELLLAPPLFFFRLT